MTKLSRHATQAAPIEDRISVYAGHDVTITPLLLALELPVHQWPPFASRLVFELYSPTFEANSDEYLFKLIYNGKDLTRQLKFCISKVGYVQTGCALRDLVHYIDNLLPSLGGATFEQACRL